MYYGSSYARPIYTDTWAARFGGAGDVSSLLKREHPPSHDRNGENALTYASRVGRTDWIRELLDAGQDVEMRDQAERTAIIQAAVRSEEEVLRLLIDRRANLDAVDKDGDTALVCAIRNGSVGCVRLLLDSGADFATTRQHSPPLAHAVWWKQIEIIHLLIERKAPLDATFPGNHTLLTMTAQAGDVEIVRLLLDARANVHERAAFDQSALSWACASGRTECVQLLLERRASVDTRNKDGDTPLIIAASKGHAHLLPILLDAGSNLETKGKHYRTALSRASAESKREVVKLLVERKAKLDTTDEHGHTPLTAAAVEGTDAHILTMLLEAGSNLEARGGEGTSTALVLAASRSSLDALRVLIGKKADLETRNKSGHTALSMAAYYGDGEVIDLLLHGGASTLTTGKERIPLSWAAERPKSVGFKLLYLSTLKELLLESLVVDVINIICQYYPQPDPKDKENEQQNNFRSHLWVDR